MDRFSTWTTPFAIMRRQRLIGQGHSEEEINAWFNTLLHSIDTATRRSYASGLLRFNQWCDTRNPPISEERRMPVSSELLALFIASKPGVSTTTINNWIAGLRYFHSIHDAPWPVDSEILTRTRMGASRLVPVSAKRAKRPPVTIDHMETLFESLDHDNPKDVAIWAIAAIAFWSCCRLQELTTDGEFLEYKHVSRGTSCTFGKTKSTSSSISNEFASLRIPWSKTTTNAGATISITARRGSALCPLRALKRHLEINANVPDHAPFFAYSGVDDEGNSSWSFLNKSKLMEECNRIWVDNALQPMPGHSFRIGGATYLLLLGTHPDIVANQGRWASRAFLGYWRDIESILPLFISTNQVGISHEDVRSSIADFAKRNNIK